MILRVQFIQNKQRAKYDLPLQCILNNQIRTMYFKRLNNLFIS